MLCYHYHHYQHGFECVHYLNLALRNHTKTNTRWKEGKPVIKLYGSKDHSWMAISNFARDQLKKYGWTEGKGLGKDENGIANPIKPKLKFDNHGLGHDSGLEYKKFWWNDVFNKVASNLKVTNGEDDVKICLKDKSKKLKKIRRQPYDSKNYSNFFKKGDETNKDFEDDYDDKFRTSLTDDEIFRKCDGRTCHKATRHGRMSAKLLRLQQQEQSFVMKSSTTNLCNEERQQKVNVSKSGDHAVKRKKKTKVKVNYLGG